MTKNDAVVNTATPQYSAAYQNPGNISNNYASSNNPTDQNWTSEVTVPVWPTRSHTYHGFSTSICDMFRNKSDCCALACCGILSHDRTRYLLTGEYPPSWRTRLFFHLILPLLIFITAGYCAVFIKNQNVNEAVSTGLILLLLGYILSGCISARQNRLHLREEILIKAGRRNEHSQLYAEHAHGFCFGCYPTNGPWDQWDDDHNESSTLESEDMCRKLWKFFAKIFCGLCAGCFCQVCGICALAQESREVEMLVEPKETWIDYVSFEVNLSCSILSLLVKKYNIS